MAETPGFALGNLISTMEFALFTVMRLTLSANPHQLSMVMLSATDNIRLLQAKLALAHTTLEQHPEMADDAELGWRTNTTTVTQLDDDACAELARNIVTNIAS